MKRNNAMKFRIGESKVVFGQIWQIIAYTDNAYITVLVDNKYQIHMSYQQFQKEQKRMPNELLRQCKVGEQVMATNGQMMTLIAYRNMFDIDIQFEDGTIRQHCFYQAFTKGEVSNPNTICTGPNNILTRAARPNRLGEKRMMNCGIEAEIIVYRSAHNIDIRFTDGQVKTGLNYCQFKAGAVRHPIIGCKPYNQDALIQRMHSIRNKWIGYKRTTDKGHLLEIIAYKDHLHVLVRVDNDYLSMMTLENYKRCTNKPHSIKIEEN